MHMNQLQELELSTEQGAPVSLPTFSHIWPFQGNHNCQAQLILYQKNQNFIRISS